MTPGRILYLTRRRLRQGVRYWLAERFFDARIDGWRCPHERSSAPVPVHVLASCKDWRMALWMLASLHETTEWRWPIVLHEDGSLGDDELRIFRSLFPSMRVVRRKEADQVMDGLLKGRPRCADYRRRMPHGLKSFDIPRFAEAPRFLLLDPDVLFFERPAEILDWVDRGDDFSCWFNRDFQEPSPIPPEQAVRDLGVPLWPWVNSGLCLLTKESVADLNAMEAWLGHPALGVPEVQWRVEQTLLALAASKIGRGGFLSPDYEVSPNKHRRPTAVARHYVGCVRERFLGEGVFDLGRRWKLAK